MRRLPANVHRFHLWTEWIGWVQQFQHNRMGSVIPPRPTVADPDTVAALIGLLHEECRETQKAMIKGDLEGVADGVADLVYSAIGAAMLFGINIGPIFAEVHTANMEKGVAAPGGFGRMTAEGKSTKENWTPPRIAELLALQSEKGNGFDS